MKLVDLFDKGDILMNEYGKKLLDGFFDGKFSENQIVEKFDFEGFTPDVFYIKRN